jgi:hypothetical protein
VPGGSFYYIGQQMGGEGGASAKKGGLRYLFLFYGVNPACEAGSNNSASSQRGSGSADTDRTSTLPTVDS